MRSAAIIVLVAAGYFAVVAPTLTWTDFSSGSENLNVATAMEIRRTGRWLVPTLQDRPRIAKPPLAAWITAALVPQSVLDALSAGDSTGCAAAYRRLMWHARWPAVVAACLTIVAAGALGWACGGGRLGVLVAVICGGNYAFLRFMRWATTDVHLTLWTTAANVFIALALLHRRRWAGWTGAGLAIALGFMSKGPVVLAQTAAPAAVFALWAWRLQRRGEARSSASTQSQRPAQKMQFVPVLVACAIFLALALPWFTAVAARFDAWQLWFREVTRAGATDLPPDNPFSYLSIFPLMLPWTVFFAGGLWMAAAAMWQRSPAAQRELAGNPNAIADSPDGRGLVFAFVFLVVPVLIMSLFRDRNERYLLPMIAPASVLAARALLDGAAQAASGSALARWGLALHWAIVAGAALALPIAGATRLTGEPWLSPAAAGALAATGAAVVAAGIALSRGRPVAGVLCVTAIVMAMAQAVFLRGYANSDRGRSELRPLAELIRARCPGAVLFNYTPGRRGPLELPIYLNRTMYVLENPADLRPSTRPGVIVVAQHYRDGMPPVPADWRHLGQVQGRRHVWHAFCVPATGP